MMAARGFSLVELMIAMVIALIVSAGAFTMIAQVAATANDSRAVDNAQQTLLTTYEALLPVLREARNVSAIDADSGEGLRVERRAPASGGGIRDCTGADTPAGADFTEFYQVDGEGVLICRNADGEEAQVAYGIRGLRLDRVYRDADGNGIANAPEDTDSGDPVVGIEVALTQDWVDERERTTRFHVALRNASLAARLNEGVLLP